MKYEVLGGRERERERESVQTRRVEKKGKVGGEKGVANERRTRGEKRTRMNGKFESYRREEDLDVVWWWRMKEWEW